MKIDLWLRGIHAISVWVSQFKWRSSHERSYSWSFIPRPRRSRSFTLRLWSRVHKISLWELRVCEVRLWDKGCVKFYSAARGTWSLILRLRATRLCTLSPWGTLTKNGSETLPWSNVCLGVMLVNARVVLCRNNSCDRKYYVLER